MKGKYNKQMMRIIRFVAELKDNKYPNAQDFARKLQNADIDENIDISCDARTIQRDIKLLKEEFGCPIEYNKIEHGYYLTRKTWELICPTYCEGIISAFMLSSRLAEDIVPQPLKSNISNASAEFSTTNNSEFLDKSFLDSLLIASGTKAVINPDIFKVIFDGWRNQEAVNIEYQRPDEKHTCMNFEPHIISFNKGIWYAKGILPKNDNIVVLALQRIKAAKLINKYFDINKELLEGVRKNGLFDYKKIEDITVHCDQSIAFYIYEHEKTKKFKITPQQDGSLLVKLAPAIEHEVIRWVLGESGKVRVIEPEWLRKKIVNAAQKTIVNNS